MKCMACKWWKQGECRKYSPTVINMEIPESKKRTHWQPTNILVTRWPETKSWQGCGEGKVP